jgi:hypothetical protein
LSAPPLVPVCSGLIAQQLLHHGEADLEESHHSPLPGAPNVGGFCVTRTWGTTQRTQRFEHRGCTCEI